MDEDVIDEIIEIAGEIIADIGEITEDTKIPEIELLRVLINYLQEYLTEPVLN